MDIFLTRAVPLSSRKQAQRLCERGLVQQNGRLARKADLVLSGAVVTVEPAPSDAAEPAPEVELDVIYEDGRLVVINKAAGIACAAVPGRTRGTLAGAILYRYPEVAEVGFGPRDPGLLHRLDTQTSGLIIAARRKDAFDDLRGALQNKEWDKRYLAIVEAGRLDDHGTCTFALAPDPKNRRRVRIVENNGKPARSEFRIIRKTRRFDLVEVRAASAYRHQVRAHLAALGAPLVGDTLYGGLDVGLGTRHALHASYIAIVTASLEVRCGLPADLRDLLADSD